MTVISLDRGTNHAVTLPPKWGSPVLDVRIASGAGATNHAARRPDCVRGRSSVRSRLPSDAV